MAMELSVALENALDGQPVPDALATAETVGELEELLGVAARGGDKARTGEGITARIDDGSEGRAETPELPDAMKDVAKAALGLLQREFYGSVMKPRVTGRAFIPHNRNCIVVANHASHLDMGLVKYALGSYGEGLVALAARDYFFEGNSLRRTLVENFTNLAPLDRHAGLRETLRAVGALLEQGKTVLIFPEGTRSEDGAIREFKGAVGHLALRHGVDVLPLYLRGTFDAMPKRAVVPTKRDLTARIGPPLEHADLVRLTAGLRPVEAARRVAQLAQRAVEELRDGRALDLSRIEGEALAEEEPRKHPLVTLFDELGERFIPGSVEQPVSFYFTLGNENEAKWTVRVGPSECRIVAGKPDGGAADCVLKTSAEIFTRIVREGYQPGAPEFLSGAIKSNDVALLQTFQQAFRLG
jgi:long-chain acyl-CoA synthetase